MKVTNWLGQDIEAGTYVYRGAREGNSSSFKIGIARKVNTQTNKVTVDWASEAPYRHNTYVYINQKRVDVDIPGVWNNQPRAGTCGTDSLVVVTERDYNYAKARNLAAKNAENAVKSGVVSPDKAREYFDNEVKRLFGELSGV